MARDEFLLHGDHGTPTDDRPGDGRVRRALRFLLALVKNSATGAETQLQQAPHEAVERGRRDQRRP